MRLSLGVPVLRGEFSAVSKYAFETRGCARDCSRRGGRVIAGDQDEFGPLAVVVGLKHTCVDNHGGSRIGLRDLGSASRFDDRRGTWGLARQEQVVHDCAEPIEVRLNEGRWGRVAYVAARVKELPEAESAMLRAGLIVENVGKSLTVLDEAADDLEII
jgi:hypothetical protein